MPIAQQTRIREWGLGRLCNLNGEITPSWVLEVSLGLLGWKDVAYVKAPNAEAARDLLKKKLCEMVDTAETK